jgi:hypothetical protein
MPTTKLRIRTPTKDLQLLAQECLDDGSFNRAVRVILQHLVELSKTHPPEQTKIRYFTNALHAFLQASGGNHSLHANPA